MEGQNIDIAKAMEIVAGWKNKNCQLCNARNWSVSNKAYELRIFTGGGLVIGNVPIIPLVPVTCENCGNTILINAKMTNLIKIS
jgi:hypothetical protein